MKNLVFVLTVLSVAALGAAPAAKSEPADPNPYAKYGPATKEAADDPMAAVWQRTNRDVIDAATTREKLAAVVADEASARRLLAKVRSAYRTDPLDATVISAVTQYVMGEDPFILFFWEDFPSSGRKVWVEALLKAAESSPDDYVRQLCLNELRWCAPPCPCVTRRIRAIGAASGSKGVRDLADLAVRSAESAK